MDGSSCSTLDISRPLYPDANGSLRFSYARVWGYVPRDGLLAMPQTTLGGQLAKHTGTEPFDLPEAVRERAVQAPDTYWADPRLGDVPVCFLSTADTTGGNSGSPVIDDKGALVGFNFDRVWENVAGDYAYRDAHSRNIVSDVRYLLWMLDEVVHADALLEELGVADYADAPIRELGGGQTPAQRANSTPTPASTAEASAGCGCHAPASASPSWAPWWAAGVLLACGRRRARRRH